ncbi:MAG: ferritin family protein [bacterium]
MDLNYGLATPMEILQEALKREHAAHDFYASVRDHVKTPLIRELAEGLCEEEQRHIRLIEKQIVKLNLG